MKSSRPQRCPACRGQDLEIETKNKIFKPGGKKVLVPLTGTRCNSCGLRFVIGSQQEVNHARLAARKSEYGNVLMGEEISAMRRYHGLTQRKASLVFGKGKIAFSRYENETSYPDDSTTKLLRLAIDDPSIVERLARMEGIELPASSTEDHGEMAPQVVLVLTERAEERVNENFGFRTSARKPPTDKMSTVVPGHNSWFRQHISEEEVFCANDGRYDDYALRACNER